MENIMCERQNRDSSTSEYFSLDMAVYFYIKQQTAWRMNEWMKFDKSKLFSGVWGTLHAATVKPQKPFLISVLHSYDMINSVRLWSWNGCLRHRNASLTKSEQPVVRVQTALAAKCVKNTKNMVWFLSQSAHLPTTHTKNDMEDNSIWDYECWPN